MSENLYSTVPVTVRYKNSSDFMEAWFDLNANLVERIDVTTPPTKKKYREGEPIVYTGMVITATFTDGTTMDVTSDCTITPAAGKSFDPDTDTFVEISYLYYGDTYTTFFTLEHVAVLGIYVTSNPTKMAYKSGELLDYTGMVVMIRFLDGTEQIITSNCTIAPAEDTPFDASDPVVDISYNYDGTEYETSLTLTVVLPVSIAVTTMPDKTLFRAGENYDWAGAVITATYSDTSIANVTSLCTFDPDENELVIFDTEIGLDDFIEIDIEETLDDLIETLTDTTAHDNIESQKQDIVDDLTLLNPDYNYIYLETPDIARPSDSTIQLYDEVLKSSDGYYHYWIDELRFETSESDGTHTNSVAFQNGTNNMRNGRPMAMLYTPGDLHIYNYYASTDRINQIARYVTLTNTAPDGTSTDTLARYSSWPATMLLSYKGNMKLFLDYDEMMAYFRSLDPNSGGVDYSTDYPYHLKLYVQHTHWQDEHYTPYVENTDYDGTIDLWSKYPIYREVRYFWTGNLYPTMQNWYWPWGRKLHLAYGISGKCEMIVESNINFNFSYRGNGLGAGSAVHTTKYSASQGLIPNAMNSNEACILDMFGYGLNSLPGGERSVGEDVDSELVVTIPGYSILGSNYCTYGVHFKTFDTRGSDAEFDYNGHMEMLSSYNYDYGCYEILEDNNPSYSSYEAWAEEMGRSSQQSPGPTVTPKPGTYTAARIDSTAQYVDEQGNLQNFTNMSAVPIQHDDENGLDYIELITDYSTGDIDTSSDTFGGVGSEQRGPVKIYFGDNSGGVDGMSYGSSLDTQQTVAVEYTEGETTLSTNFNVTLRSE